MAVLPRLMTIVFLEQYRDTNGRRIVIHIGGVYILYSARRRVVTFTLPRPTHFALYKDTWAHWRTAFVVFNRPSQPNTVGLTKARDWGSHFASEKVIQKGCAEPRNREGLHAGPKSHVIFGRLQLQIPSSSCEKTPLLPWPGCHG